MQAGKLCKRHWAPGGSAKAAGETSKLRAAAASAATAAISASLRRFDSRWRCCCSRGSRFLGGGGSGNCGPEVAAAARADDLPRRWLGKSLQYECHL